MQIRQEYLNALICHLFFTAYWNFGLSHVLLSLTIAELSTLKQVRFFGPPCSFTTNAV